VGLWKGLETAAIECMSRAPGDVVQVWTLDPNGNPMHQTPLTFRRNSQALAMRLPSGRSLLYWTPRMRLKETPFGQRWALTYRAEDSVKHRWSEFVAYGGLFCENAVQAVARDIMRDALLRLYRGGILPVLTVHDEAICELFAVNDEWAAMKVENAMLVPSAWAPGLPIAADSSAGPRYIKGIAR
jgi:DNA polymerase